MATQNDLFNISKPAAADLSDEQFYAVYIDSSGNCALTATEGGKSAGILQNAPAAATRAATICVYGTSKAVAGGTITMWDPLTSNASGTLIVADEETQSVLGRALQAAASGETFEMLILHEGSAAQLDDVVTQVSSANYATTGQYLAVKAHSVAGQIVRCTTGGEAAMGILTNAPASAASATVKTTGIVTAQAGTGGVTPGVAVAVEVTTSQLIPAVAGDYVVGYALATIVAGANGLFFLQANNWLSVDGQALANTKVWVGSAGGVAAAQTIGTDATLAANGALTIANDVVSAAKMGTTSTGVIYKGAAADAVTELQLTAGLVPMGEAGDVGTVDFSGTAGDLLISDGATGIIAPMTGVVAIDGTGLTTFPADVVGVAAMSTAGTGVIYKGAAPDAVTELTLSEGLIPLGEAADVGTVDMGAVAGNILVDSGTTAVSVTVSGDAALAAGGALTLDKSLIRQATTTWASGLVVAGNVTPLVLLDFSAQQAAGTVAAGDCFVFHGLVANLYGGVAYDQAENSIIKYQTAGGGATISLTLVNWFNAGADGAVTTLKPVATDVALEINEDLVWTMSASPFAAAGTRALSVTCYFSVFTPAT